MSNPVQPLDFLGFFALHCCSKTWLITTAASYPGKWLFDLSLVSLVYSNKSNTHARVMQNEFSVATLWKTVLNSLYILRLKSKWQDKHYECGYFLSLCAQKLRGVRLCVVCMKNRSHYEKTLRQKMGSQQNKGKTFLKSKRTLKSRHTGCCCLFVWLKWK